MALVLPGNFDLQATKPWEAAVVGYITHNPELRVALQFQYALLAKFLGAKMISRLISGPQYEEEEEEEEEKEEDRAQELCESPGGRPGLPSLISLRFL